MVGFGLLLLVLEILLLLLPFELDAQQVDLAFERDDRRALGVDHLGERAIGLGKRGALWLGVGR